MADFAYNAPNFYDFNKPVDEKVDLFFDIQQETTEVIEKKTETICEDILSEKEEVKEEPPRVERNTSRRSRSVDGRNLKYASTDNLASGVSRLSRAASREHLNKLSQPKHAFSSQENFRKNEFVSMAEAVNKYQRGTPERFKTRPKAQNSLPSNLRITIPNSPALKTKARHRPTNVMSTEERQQLEFEQAQKFKIRAHPVNEKVLQGPLKAQVQIVKQPVTIPQPFKLTAVPKKVQPSPKKEVPEFHARPVPKSLHSVPHEPIVSARKLTNPQTPMFMKHYKPPIRLPVNEPKKDAEKHKEPSKVPVPFSFEKRDQQIQKKKEELIKKVLQEEKKAREFHANPMPKSYKANNSSLTNRSKFLKNDENGVATSTKTHAFKARSPTVLYKKPFIPKHGDRPLTEISEFQLYSNRRAEERKEFDGRYKEREEQLKLLKKLEEEERLKEEEEERARIRRDAEYKAQPIKKYRPVVIVPSNKVTEPVSPSFMTTKLREANKENIDTEHRKN